ncbi:MAG: hypothetical protein ABSC00_04435 [Acidimicrobiales bacterium]
MGTSTPWMLKRVFPLLTTVILIAVGMASSTWWGPHLAGKPAWQLPDDLWGTMIAAQRLLHLHIGGLYTPPTGLVALPGAAVALVPIAALIDAAGLGFDVPGVHDTHPASWLVAGPYEIALSATALFAADSIAERLGASRPKRMLLATGGGVTLWSVSVRWGHPEDAVAVALLMYGVLALADSRTERSAFLLGVAVAVQPLVLLAVPVLVVMLEPRRVTGYLTRAAAPGAALLVVALAANWRATLTAVADQPNWPVIDHPTPWIALAPHMSHGAVAAGPGRGIAVVLACACALMVERRWGGELRTTEWSSVKLTELLWWMAVALALRCVFESVMVAYYVWPVLAMALVAAVRHWSRLIPATATASALTFVSQASWRGRWTWWTAVTAGLVLALVFARGTRSERRLRQMIISPEVPPPLATTSSQGSQDNRLRNTT